MYCFWIIFVNAFHSWLQEQASQAPPRQSFLWGDNNAEITRGGRTQQPPSQSWYACDSLLAEAPKNEGCLDPLLLFCPTYCKHFLTGKFCELWITVPILRTIGFYQFYRKSSFVFFLPVWRMALFQDRSGRNLTISDNFFLIFGMLHRCSVARQQKEMCMRDAMFELFELCFQQSWEKSSGLQVSFQWYLLTYKPS